MSCRVHVRDDLLADFPLGYDAIVSAEGVAIARSNSSATVQIEFGGRSFVRKCYAYSQRTALKAALRNTLIRPSRAAREFRALCVFRERLCDGAVPEPVAFGERRTLFLLREAFLLTLAVPGAVSLSSAAVPSEVLGSFLARLHRAGLLHGSLFARNVLLAPDGSICVVDLDRAQMHAPGHLPSLTRRARDLEFLASSTGIDTEIRRQLVGSYAAATGEREGDVASAMTGHREEAERRLRRRTKARPAARSAQ